MMHTADSYRSEWATLTGRSESEIYVPVALRTGPGVLPFGTHGELTAEREPTLDELREALRGES